MCQTWSSVMFAKDIVGAANGMFATQENSNSTGYCYLFLTELCPFLSQVLLPDGGILEEVSVHLHSTKNHSIKTPDDNLLLYEL
jgi:hypothetical protein